MSAYIGQTWVNVHLKASGKSAVPYPMRTFLLTLINYAEVIVRFSVLGYIFRQSVILSPPIIQMQQSVMFTIGTMSAIGSAYEPTSAGGWILYISELGFTLLFILAIIQRAVDILPKRNS